MFINEKVLQIGHVFKKVENQEIIGIVHSIFTKNVNLYIKKLGLITLCTLDIPMSSMHGKTKVVDFNKLKIEDNQKIFIKNNKINFGHAIFDFSKSEKYKSPFERNAIYLASKEEILSILYQIINTVIKNKPDGFIPLFPYILDLCQGFKPIRLELPVFASRGYCLITELASHLLRGDYSLFLKNAISLIGLGPGLTPSGDDFLSGFMIGYITYSKHLNSDSRFVKEVFPLIVRNSFQRTNYLSYQQLLLASLGHGYEILEQLCLDILQADFKKVSPGLERIVNIGSTSGMDQLIGLLFGIGILVLNKSNVA